MNDLAAIRRMWSHAFWADDKMLDALTSSGETPYEAVREFAHVIGTEEVWLARIQHRAPDLEVWPAVRLSGVEAILAETHGRWEAYLERLEDSDLDRPIEYANSAGREFENSAGDILIHAALHGQYHRGKVNRMLREAGLEPAPVDYIAFVRGAPAATEADARARRGRSSG